MNSIEDWQQGWNETEALLAYLSAQTQSYRQAHPPSSDIGKILFDAWSADLAGAKDDAVKHKSATRIEPSLRALSFEEDKLEDWASWLDQRMTSMTGLRRYIAQKWRDAFREEAELDRQLIAAAAGMSVGDMDAE